MPFRQYAPSLMKHFSVGEISGLLDLVQKFLECTTVDELESVLSRLDLIVPTDYYACLFSQNCSENRCEGYQLVTTNFPEQWVSLYVEKEYYQIDPIVAECHKSKGLSYWADVYEKCPPEISFLSEAVDFGLVNGYASGMRNLVGSRCGIISLSGRELTRTERNNIALEIIVPHIYQAMDRIVYLQKVSGVPTVSPREKEVLKWITQGKTTWETSVILGMSERTVKYHVSNIMKKLNATSRAHAAAIALELKLVELD